MATTAATRAAATCEEGKAVPRDEATYLQLALKLDKTEKEKTEVVAG